MSGGKTVLIVEDDDDLRRLLRLSLSMAGYTVEDVATGFKALRRLDTVKPDLILIDADLAGLDRLTVLDELAAHAHTRNIPVLVFAATDAEAQTLNVRWVLKKPVTNERLLQAVRECLASGAPPPRA